MDNLTPPASPLPSTPAAGPTTLPPGSYREALTPREAETMAGWIKEDLAKGKLSVEAAAKSFDQLNATPEQRSPDTRTADEIAFDTLWPAAKPEDFLIQYDHLDPNQPIPPEVQQFDKAARTWLSESGVPREIGNSLVHAVDRAGKQTASMNAAELDRYADAQYTILERTFGADLESKLQQAGRMVQELEKRQPGLNALLRSGVGDDARVAAILIQQAERYHARRGAQGTR